VCMVACVYTHTQLRFSTSKPNDGHVHTYAHVCVLRVYTHAHTHTRTHTHTHTHTQVRDLKGAVEQNGKVGELDSGRRYANALPAVMAAATLQLSQLVSLVAGFEV